MPADATCRVLIVDDSDEDRESYKRYLSQSRSPTYEFSEAITVEEGLERFAESLPDCVLLDYMLPDGNGLDFLERASAEFSAHQIRVVQVEVYVRDHTEAQFSDGICPDCAQKLFPRSKWGAMSARKTWVFLRLASVEF